MTSVTVVIPALVCAVSTVQVGSLTKCCHQQPVQRRAPLTPVKESSHTSSIGTGTTQVPCTHRQTDRQTNRQETDRRADEKCRCGEADQRDLNQLASHNVM